MLLSHAVGIVAIWAGEVGGNDPVAPERSGAARAVINESRVVEILQALVAMPIQDLSDPQVFCVCRDSVYSFNRSVEQEVERLSAKKVSGASRGIVVGSAVFSAKVAVVIVPLKSALDESFRAAVGIRKTSVNEVIIPFRCPSQ